MAKGNGKNGNGQNGNGAKDGGAGEATTSNSGNGFRAGRGVASHKEAPTWAVAEPPAPAIVVPPRSLTPLVVGATALALGGGAVYAVHRWRQQQRVALDTGAPEPGRTPGTSTPTSGTSTSEGPASETPASEAPSSAPAAPGVWGTANLGEVYRPLLAKLEEVTGMPLRLYLCVVANREAGWNRTARNKTKKETDASRDGINNGIERGNPAPKFADSIRGAGSGGLFGALAPFVAWTGYDEGYMPYLDEDWPIIEDPIVAAICAAKMYQRFVGGGRYPVFANPAKPAPEDNYRVRLGWARPATLKKDPGGTLFQDVKKRFDEDLAQLGLKISDLSPPNADRWPGLKAVVAGMQGFPVTWK